MLLILLACAPATTLIVGEGLNAQRDADGATHLGKITLRTQEVSREGGTTLPAGVVTEWWRSATGGVEQGWDIAQKPAGSGGVVITVRVGVDVVALEDGLRIGDTLRAHAAAAWDANGTPLAVKMLAADHAFTVVTDDTNAVYPITVDPLYSTAVWSVEGNQSGAECMNTVAMDGDADGDGYDDALVGCWKYDSGSTDEGKAWVYSGSTTGLETTSSWSAESNGANRYFAKSVAWVGDTNGDGYDDALIGSSVWDYTTTDDGRATLYRGSASGLSTTSTWTYSPGVASVLAGYTVAGLGDLDDDGYDDFGVAAPYADIGGTNTGSIYVFYGSSGTSYSSSPDSTINGAGASALCGEAFDGGDVDADGFSDLIVGRKTYTGTYTSEGAVYLYRGESGNIPTIIDQTVTGGATNADMGETVAFAGDTNGDGYGDVVTGTATGTAFAADGTAWVWEGKSGGLETTYQMRSACTATACNYFGYAVSAGDLDDDGFTDVIVGDPGYAVGSDYGKIFVYWGAAAGVSVGSVSTLNPTGSEFFGYAMSTGDTNADGMEEMLIADPDYTNGSSLEGITYVFGAYRDSDGDGATFGAGGTDCNDGDSSIYPSATEVVADGVDQDCDGYDACYADDDGDGYGSATETVATADADCTDAGEASAGTDCDDAAATAHPGGTETTGDGIDGDCNGKENCYADADHDGYGVSTSTVVSSDLDCADSGEATTTTDCSDASSSIHPGASETVADGIDQDCDSGDTCYTDSDADTYGSSTTRSSSDLDCTDASEANDKTDCNDASSTIHPSAAETTADGVDQDCDNGDTCFTDSDRDGYGSTTTKTSTDLDCSDSTESSNDDDCDDTAASISPVGTEKTADGIDQDCDNGDVCFYDQDGDTYGSTTTVESADLVCTGATESENDDDCVDTDKSIYPGADEVAADRVDQDCDGADACYEDLDSDGFGSETLVDAADFDCAEATESDVSGDCDDLDRSRNPNAEEILGNGVDEDCDGSDGCYVDSDGDGFGSDEIIEGLADCESEGASPSNGDCDDTEADVNPDESETCNVRDDNCDGLIDNDPIDPSTWYLDEDDDGYGVAETSTEACDEPDGYASRDGDCDDADEDYNPGVDESCTDDHDFNCDGTINGDDPDCKESEDTGGFDFGSDLGNDGKKSDDDSGGICGCASEGAGPAGAGWAGLLGLSVIAARRRRG